MRSHPTVHEVARNFSAYVDRVAHRGERFVLMEGKRPVAELCPVAPEGLRLRDLPDLLASLPRLSPEELADFEADLTAIRHEADPIAPRDPWES